MRKRTNRASLSEVSRSEVLKDNAFRPGKWSANDIEEHWARYKRGGGEQ